MRSLPVLAGLLLLCSCSTDVITSSDGSGGGTASGTGATTSSGDTGCSECSDNQMCVSCSDDVGDTWSYCAAIPAQPDPNGPPHFACSADHCQVGTEVCVKYTFPYCGCSPAPSYCEALPLDCQGCDCVSPISDCDATYCEQDTDGNITISCDSLLAC
jgi:hypothetical protein